MRIYGNNPVLERLRSAPQTIRRIYIQPGHSDAGYIYKKAKQRAIPVLSVPKTKIQKLARNVNTQGLLVEVDDFLYVEYPDLLTRAQEKRLTLIFLDGIRDPQNLGGMIRSAACLGGFAVILPSHDSTEVTEAVLRVACGGENFVPIAKVANIVKAVRRAKEAGFSIAGTVVGGGKAIWDAGLRFPLGLVIGSEEKGIRPVLEGLLDDCVTLPMAVPRMSLNAAHAATVFCYEIVRQRAKRG